MKPLGRVCQTFCMAKRSNTSTALVLKELHKTLGWENKPCQAHYHGSKSPYRPYTNRKLELNIVSVKITI